MAGLYDIIADLRRENQTPSATRTLDLVTTALGRHQDNLRAAIATLPDDAIPTGGRALMEDLQARARAEGVDDLHTPRSQAEIAASTERVDASQVGIALLMGGTAVVAILLVAIAIVAYTNSVAHFIH
jgi:hypothetical protein